MSFRAAEIGTLLVINPACDPHTRGVLSGGRSISVASGIFTPQPRLACKLSKLLRMTGVFHLFFPPKQFLEFALFLDFSEPQPGSVRGSETHLG